MPFGQGDSPLRECLRLLRKNRCKIPAHIEHDRGGTVLPQWTKSTSSATGARRNDYFQTPPSFQYSRAGP